MREHMLYDFTLGYNTEEATVEYIIETRWFKKYFSGFKNFDD